VNGVDDRGGLRFFPAMPEGHKLVRCQISQARFHNVWRLGAQWAVSATPQSAHPTLWRDVQALHRQHPGAARHLRHVELPHRSPQRSREQWKAWVPQKEIAGDTALEKAMLRAKTYVLSLTGGHAKKGYKGILRCTTRSTLIFTSA